ncbi:MAG TPA: glycosyltransferase family 4 protein [Candidatus Binatia bacterium]|nr:glycosyltransferase family 4 protein [Candidatus Binatia bacterium]
MAMARAGGSLLVGRRLRGGPGATGKAAQREPRVPNRELARAALAMERGELEVANELTADLVTRYPNSRRTLDLRRRVLARMGELTERARILHRVHELSDDPMDLSAERSLLGRILETEPGWLPTIPGPPRPLEPESDDVVMHLQKASVPYLLTGFTMRQRYNVMSAAAAGVRPVSVTPLGFPRELGFDDFPAYEVLDGIPHYHLDLGPSYPLNRPVDLLLEDNAWLMARVAREVRPAVIHASSGHRGYEFALIGQALRAHLGIPLVYEVRSFFEATWAGDEAWLELGEYYRRRFDTETRTMQAADHVITIAEAMREEIIQRGVDPERVTVVPNAVDVDIFKPMPKDPGLMRRYGTEGVFTIGYVSNIDHPREGHEGLIDVTKVLRERGRRVRTLIVGDGKRADLLKDYARQVGVADDVVFTGLVPHDQVASHYALLDAFVVPRRDERASRVVTPLKPYEALAMARPMIIADLPALREIANPDERGLAYPAGDIAAMADAIERVMDDPGLAARLGEAGRKWVATTRRWADNGPRFRDVYRKVLEEKRRREAAA